VTVAVIVTVWLLLSGPDENIVAHCPLELVSALDALSTPPVVEKVTVTASIGTLFASKTVAVIVDESESSDFTDTWDRAKEMLLAVDETVLPPPVVSSSGCPQE
jgi:hypothetical protein